MSFSSTADPTSYDLIFAGGGTTACVVAGRLAEADPSLRILIIEAGSHTLDNTLHTQPAQFLRNLVTPGDTFSHHAGAPSEALDGRSAIVQTGRCMGGGSGVNFMMYTRASASDYDDWEKFGNPGWGSKDLIPLSNKAETYQSAASPADVNHGSSGPIKVSSGIRTSIGEQFLTVASAYDKEREFKEDTNDFVTCNTYSRWDRYIDEASGRRSDAAHHYIYDKADNKNLQVLTRHRVTRVIFENERAVGVEFIDDAKRGSGQETIKAFASRLVVLSAGSFGSVAILERSGIGAKYILDKHNIPQIVDLPGVGENYNDHNLIFPTSLASEDADTLDEIFWGEKDEVEAHSQKWSKDGTGLMAENGISSGIKIRPTAKDLETLGPAFAKRWEEFFLDAPDKPVMWIGPYAGCCTGLPNLSRRKYFCVGYYTEYPVSLGRVHIKSAIDPYAQFDFHPGFLDHPADVAVLRWSYKHAREMLRRMDAYRGLFAGHHPKFPQGSEAANEFETNGPVDISAPDIVYTAEDDEAIDDYHKEFIGTTWHSLGTCAMKPREQAGVVDSSLSVYGIQNLKVADMSIAPSNVGANTYNTALVIGEKAAVIIASELGIKGVN